ncbi:TetR/AcrR family transcriptional regulator [Cryobacterium sp. TMT1-21]|uniref:TetR/AcrR family transcriptional regulator n=1 Tax=Cryobacterium shii TaxID=1259235 RepID=A0AAQ2C4T1_9MICO|nr:MULTISPECIES: TetR/AcrR family transcriptional regulator [Cryobacterium]TFC43815.1 TetR/AcrR family transcriptional regulator [Cryobacterium shii]TFD14008.1 TetR/AcrR family transcriptional regulator [Cryobacterium sp. TMT1-21]TFD16320.1 TetR/AcrR family transcriptional regulator [Cryobacterium sp. TMT4-10]TFD27403.1 TetR/AcrR family transcriptional regulator [Cryobacterium sp. TMT2-23]
MPEVASEGRAEAATEGALQTAAEAAPTPRSRAKADRRQALLGAAATLFARSGYNGVSIEDLGAAVGVSGPAVYRHFSGKPAVLAALLVEVSETLVAGGRQVIDRAPDAAAALRELVRFHTDFALSNPDVIRVQDRDLDSLATGDRHRVRALQRAYVELWVSVLGQVHPGVDAALLRIRAQATFGLLNSTPHTLPASPSGAVRPLLEEMALAALGAS